MGFLKALGNVASGFSDVGSIASGAGSWLGLGKGIAGLFGGDDTKKQMQMQKDLMSYQNDMNKANSMLDYQRQRQLTLDNASLQKQGLRAAGQNTALGDGSTASAASVGGTSSVTPPSALPTQASIDSQYLDMINNTSASLSSGSLQSSQKQLVDSQRHSQDIKNAFEIDRQISEIESLHKANKISDAEYETRMENLKRLQDTHDSFVKQEDEKANQAEIETNIKNLQEKQEGIKTDILNVTKQLSDEQFKQAKFITEHQLERYTKEMAEIASRIKANNASAAASFASAALSHAQKIGQDIQNQLERAKVPFAGKLATYFVASAMNAANISGEQFKLATINTKRADLDYQTEKEFHSSESLSFSAGELLRNTFAGWFPFTGSVSASKTIK